MPRYSHFSKNILSIIGTGEAKWNQTELHFVMFSRKKKACRSVKYVLYVFALRMLISTIAAYVCDNLS